MENETRSQDVVEESTNRAATGGDGDTGTGVKGGPARPPRLPRIKKK